MKMSANTGVITASGKSTDTDQSDRSRAEYPRSFEYYNLGSLPDRDTTNNFGGRTNPTAEIPHSDECFLEFDLGFNAHGAPIRVVLGARKAEIDRSDRIAPVGQVAAEQCNRANDITVKRNFRDCETRAQQAV